MPIVPSQTSNILVPGYASGRYYTTQNIHNTITQTLATNNLYYLPVYIAAYIQIIAIAARVSTALAGTCRLGIYDNSNGLPSNRILDAGTIDTSSTGVKELAVSSLYLKAGWHWFTVFAGNAATFDSTNGTISNGIIGNSIVTTTQVTGLRATLTYTTLPTVAPLTSLLYASSVPLLWFKVG